MPKVLPNITYENEGGQSTVDSPSSMYKLPYEKDDEYFSNLESRTRFLKGCEKLVRKDKRYKKYINYLKKEVKYEIKRISNLNIFVFSQRLASVIIVRCYII